MSIVFSRKNNIGLQIAYFRTGIESVNTARKKLWIMYSMLNGRREKRRWQRLFYFF